MIIKKLHVMGRMIIETMPFEDVEATFMETDFTERSTLNVILDNDIKPYIVINKLNFLLHKIWDGKDASKIDGKLQHFSRTEFLKNHNIKKVKGVNVSLGEIIGSNFKPNIEEFNYNFQKKFRHQSIFIILIKDFICAAIIVVIFQYINYLYLESFTLRKYN